MSLVNNLLRGTDDDAPISGSDEYSYWLRIANAKKNELYEDTAKQWRCSFAVRSLGIITASAAPEYETEEGFLSPSDKVYVIATNGQRVEYDIVQPQERSIYRRQVFMAGADPETLYFTDEIKSTDSIVGGTLYLPGYWLPDDLTGDRDSIVVPNVYWLAYATASEIAANDIVYEDKEANLNAKANNLYKLMVKKNRGGTHRNPRSIPVVVNRIQGV